MLITPGSQKVKIVEELKINTEKRKSGIDGQNWIRLKQISFG